MKKFDLSLFEDAADFLQSVGIGFCCTTISRMSRLKGGLGICAERKLFERVYGVSCENKHYTFEQFFVDMVKEGNAGECDLLETRLLALCFVHEIARLKNNRKYSGF